MSFYITVKFTLSIIHLAPSISAVELRVNIKSMTKRTGVDIAKKCIICHMNRNTLTIITSPLTLGIGNFTRTYILYNRRCSVNSDKWLSK